MNLLGWLFVGFVVALVGTAVYWGSGKVTLGATQLMQPKRTLPSKTPADFGLTAETVRFSANGIDLVAWYIPPAAENGATLIYVHGFGGNRGGLLPQAAAMQQQGYGALLLDLRNHGESGDAPTTWGYSEANDVLAAYDYLLTRPEVDPARVGLVGKSMGGAAVVRAASQLPNLALLVIESSYSSFEENLPNIVNTIARAPRFLATPILSRVGAETGVSFSEIDSVKTVATLNLPILLIHGERDRLVPVEQGRAIFTAVNQPKTLYIVPGAGHLNIFTIDPDTFTEQMGAFLAEYLR
ncbi:hypothetical protein MNBD_CHLOROFLEXI01-1970 [hydrothermal vent metagenome]|uniref:Peptidase S9 prolyl oligopeptidase catalytic domain-containing protein n=1 Tax=hydrothermal vent metagenome TaxID=652676 RepID=A0A3B0VJT5_9ZZZZ